MRGGCGVSTYLIFTYVHTLYHTYMHTYLHTYVPTYDSQVPTYLHTYDSFQTNFLKYRFACQCPRAPAFCKIKEQMHVQPPTAQTLPQDGDSRRRANIHYQHRPLQACQCAGRLFYLNSRLVFNFYLAIPYSQSILKTIYAGPCIGIYRS